jgi:uncharacterized membrane protein YkvA (DUF1232 family)
VERLSERPITIELNPKERGFYDRLRERVVAPEPGAGSGLRDLLLLLPDLTVLLMRLVRDDRVPVGSKLIAAAGVAYVFSPIDLIPTFIFGPLGLVDDLFFVGSALSGMLNNVHPDVVRGHWPGQGDALETIQRVTSWSETQIRSRLRRLLRLDSTSRAQSRH